MDRAVAAAPQQIHHHRAQEGVRLTILSAIAAVVSILDADRIWVLGDQLRSDQAAQA